MSKPSNSREAPKESKTTGSGVARATGREREEWFELLDAWGAESQDYREIADWLTTDHELSTWWAQKLIVEYQQERGLRVPGSRPDGTFTTTVSRTVDVEAGRAFEAILDVRLREQWLPGAVMAERTSQPGRSARFDWGTGASRVSFTLDSSGGAKTQVGVAHERLESARSAEEMNAYWQERLTQLKHLLETPSFGGVKERA